MVGGGGARQRPGDGEAVIGGGAAANFVENDEAAGGSVVEDVGGLVHLDHEGGVAAGEFVAGADREKMRSTRPSSVARGHPRPVWANEINEGYLTNVGGLARHVAGDEGICGVFGSRIELAVVGDKGHGSGERSTRAGGIICSTTVATLVDFEAVGRIDVRAVAPLSGEAGQP